MKESNLIIEGLGFPRFSLRRTQEKLEPIRQAVFERTINGELIDLVPDTHKKYKLTLSCREKNAPGFLQAGVGSQVTVVPISQIWEEHTFKGDEDEAFPKLKRPLGGNNLMLQKKMNPQK